MKHLSFSVAVFILLSLYSSCALADEFPWKHSASPKLMLFFPNQNTEGLKDYGAGVGTGGDVRFTILSTGIFNLQAGPEMDLIVGSTRKIRTSAGVFGTYEETSVFNMYQTKANLIGEFLPQRPVSIFVGGSLVYNYVFIFGTASFMGSDVDITGTGPGLGAQVMGGINIRTKKVGAVTIELTVPIAQRQDVDFTFTDQRTGNDTYTYTADMDVGGIELMVGYRFNFALPYTPTAAKPEPAPEGQPQEEKPKEGTQEQSQ